MFDAIVIGAGVMGSAAAYHLAKDKQRVLLLEQFNVGHARGSSHGESRIFRFAYPELDYARLAMQCKPMWRALEAEADQSLLRDTGGLDFADEPDAFGELDQVARSLEQSNCAFEQLDAAQLAQRFPPFRLSESAKGIYSPDAGVLHATRCVQTFVARAVAHGAVLRDMEPARNILVSHNDVEVTTEKSRYRGRKLVVTAGAWANHVLRQVGLELPIRAEQEQLCYFKPARDAARFALGAFPVWIHYRAAAGNHAYGFPVLDTPGAKMGFHHDGHFVDIDEYTAIPRDAVVERVRDYVRHYLPALDGEMIETLTCIYTNTPDHNFIVDIAPGAPNVIIGSPCSGHGFKFAIGIGRALADLALHGATDMHIAHVRTLSANVP